MGTCCKVWDSHDECSLGKDPGSCLQQAQQHGQAACWAPCNPFASRALQHMLCWGYVLWSPPLLSVILML